MTRGTETPPTGRAGKPPYRGVGGVSVPRVRIGHPILEQALNACIAPRVPSLPTSHSAAPIGSRLPVRTPLAEQAAQSRTVAADFPLPGVVW